jgi:hypothetical protein
VLILVCTEFGHEDDPTTEEDVFDEFDRIRQKNGIKKWAAKFVDRKYAFGEVGIIEGESKWMKVVYGYDGASLYYMRHFPQINRGWSRRTCFTNGFIGGDIQPSVRHKHVCI